MNNIEIIKDLEKYISFANKQGNFSSDTEYQWHKELADMIENLIQEYKELKEKNLSLNQELAKRNWVKVKENGEIESLFYIPKSKVKEKIEEINNEELNYNEDDYWVEQLVKGYAIDKIQELLED